LVLSLVWGAVLNTFAVCVLLLFAKVLLRRDWIALVAVVLLANTVTIVQGPHLLIQIAFEVPAAAIAVWLLIRWGVLPVMVAFFISGFAAYTPITVDFAAWHSGPTLVVSATALMLAIWAFVVALAGRPLFEDELLQRA
jgi:hypothetical protein